MITVSLQQGTDAWHAFRQVKFTASDAAAMLGLSKYKSRDQLLREKKYGITEEVSPEKQRLFDNGHKTEEMQRPLIEQHIGEELFPATAYSAEWDRIAASFDGITMMEDVIFEHKLWSQDLVSYINANSDLPDTHWPQVEQQLYVSRAGVCYFVVSDGTEENRVILEYVSKKDRRNAVLDGWRQFEQDLETYKAKDIKEKPAAEAIRDLPALTYKLDRTTLTLQSNMEPFKAAAMALVEKSREPLKTDQDFANAEAMVKVFKSTEDKLSMLVDGVMAEIVDVATFVKDVRQISESIRQARLAADKQVKTRKDEIKAEIVSLAMEQMKAHYQELDGLISPFIMPRGCDNATFANAMKGKKTLKSCHDAVDEAIASAKIAANKTAENIKINAAKYRDVATGFEFLFPDVGSMIYGEPEVFTAIIKGRVSDHKEQQAKRDAEAAAAASAAAAAQEAANTSQCSQADAQATGGSYYHASDDVRQRLSDITNFQGGTVIPPSPVGEVATILLSELRELQEKAAMYDALMAAGVDNWDGYSAAISGVFLEEAE